MDRPSEASGIAADEHSPGFAVVNKIVAHDYAIVNGPCKLGPRFDADVAFGNDVPFENRFTAAVGIDAVSGTVPRIRRVIAR